MRSADARGVEVSQLFQDPERIVLEQHGQLGVPVPRVDDRALVDVERFTGERRDERPRLLQLDVALARLLGVVEGIAVQDAPDELPRDVLESELEVCVLVDGVMARLERECANRVALAIRDLVDCDNARGIARARRGNRTVERMLGCIAQRDQRRGSGERRANGIHVRGGLVFVVPPVLRVLVEVRQRLESLHPIEEQHAVEMIVFVLHDARGKIGERQLDA